MDSFLFAMLPSIWTEFFRLINYPRVLRKAQEEVDSVCDDGAMPKWSDYDSLPYVRMSAFVTRFPVHGIFIQLFGSH